MFTVVIFSRLNVAGSIVRAANVSKLDQYKDMCKLIWNHSVTEPLMLFDSLLGSDLADGLLRCNNLVLLLFFACQGSGSVRGGRLKTA